MEELLMRYRRLIQLLEMEEEKIGVSLEGELKEVYRSVLQRERQELVENLISIQRLL